MTEKEAPFSTSTSSSSSDVTPFARVLEHFRQGRFKTAGDCVETALQSEPNNAQLWQLAGSVARELGQFDQAERCFRTVLVLDPNSAEAHYNLGILMQEKGRLEEAALHYRAALTRPAWHARAFNNLGVVLLKEDKPDQALRNFQQAAALNPGYGIAHHNCGRTLTTLGRIEEAQKAFELAIANLPESAQTHVYRNLSTIKRFAAGDSALSAMEALAQRTDILGANEQMELNFALGKAYADLGEHSRAFTHFLAGNREKRRQTAYDEASSLEKFERIRTAYSPALMSARQGLGCESKAPIFIVGMPRSGSTLVEQILSSHPDVYAGGERDDLNQMVAALRCPDGTPLHPDGIAKLPDKDFRELGQRYVLAMQALSPQSPRITDKALKNFEHVGLIHLALPNARIIHTRRDPVETCLSCFVQLFAGDFPYTYDLAELGRYWRASDQLMAHWRSVIPASVFLEISYEALVDDLEAQTRRLLAHCGLDWHPSCLDFHRNPRPVYTASATQVRQPIYRSSMQKSKTYGDLLQPLMQALQDS
jgi:Tfp pilus assembly protein PilF